MIEALIGPSSKIPTMVEALREEVGTVEGIADEFLIGRFGQALEIVAEEIEAEKRMMSVYDLAVVLWRLGRNALVLGPTGPITNTPVTRLWGGVLGPTGPSTNTPVTQLWYEGVKKEFVKQWKNIFPKDKCNSCIPIDAELKYDSSVDVSVDHDKTTYDDIMPKKQRVLLGPAGPAL